MSRDDTRLRTTVYRKPSHIDRLLDQSSYNPTSHRATTVRTLTRHAQIICDSADSLRDENEHLRQIFHKNDYSDEFIDTNKYKQNKQNDKCANTETKNELTTVSLPYIRGTSETIARILKPFSMNFNCVSPCLPFFPFRCPPNKKRPFYPPEPPKAHKNFKFTSQVLNLAH